MPPDIVFPIGCTVALFGLVLLLVILIQRSQRIERAIAHQVEVIRERDQPIMLVNHRISAGLIQRLNEPQLARLRGCVVSIGADRIAIYERCETLPERFQFRPDQLRWFGRPHKYTSGRNEIWLHVDDDSGWHLIRLWFYRDDMRDLVRTLKAVVVPELVTAYRRQRPYIHVGPVRARPANQDLQGAWRLAEPLLLYLMPRFLVLLHGTTVLRAIPLEQVRHIGALRRLDQPGAHGLVRFRAEDEDFAFALPRHQQFANSLARAARLTLEAPLERKRKGKTEEEEEF